MKTKLSRFSFLFAVIALSGFLTGCNNPESDFKKAELTNTEQAYSDFIKKHPGSPLIAEAKKQIEKNAYEEARKAGTVSAFEKFLGRFQNGELPQKARLDMEAVEFSKATTALSIPLWEAFLHKYQQSTNRSRARQQLARILLEQVAISNTVSAYEDFTKQFGETEAAKEALKRVEVLEYQEATNVANAELGITEVQARSYVYAYKILKRTQIGHIVTGNGPADSTVSYSDSYCGKNLVFYGDMACFVGAVGSTDYRSRIINVASITYDPDKTDNPPLSALGVVALNEKGIVKSALVKTGWINWGAFVTFDDAGRSRTVKLEDVTFWVNRGGENWLSFSIGKVREWNSDETLGAEIPSTVSLDRAGLNGSVTIRLADKYNFRPSIKNHTTLTLVPVGG